jgi:AraC-like DNA-binding protein
VINAGANGWWVVPRPPIGYHVQVKANQDRSHPDATLTRDQPVFVLHRGGLGARPPARPVTHNYAALVFYTDGAAVLEQRGRWSLKAGDALLVPAGEPHRLIEAQNPEQWGLGFCPVCFIADGAADLLEPFERVRAGAAAVSAIPVERHAHMETLFRELHREIELPGPASQAVQKSLVTLILAEVARASFAGPTEAATGSPVADALRFIERRCLEPISLEDVAKAAQRSPAHLTTLVRRATGRSVKEWIIAGRLSEARRRLSHTAERVDIIAERVGYADVTHFIRLFRRAYGATPAAWRAQSRKVP